MDETFDEWVQNDAQQPCVRKWADALIDLGTSWDSFRRDDASIVQDLVDAGGIPLLAARDIVKIAKEEIEKGNAPMAIFWDLENMPIPSSKSGRDVTSRLKFILAPYGNLVQFRGYASIGLNLIPQQKRSDLQLSGCHLVDCPHNGRKEVADKMIIVDAMQFAFMNPKGATLCFITGDVDYAYTLAVLQRPCWRTIVISKGTIRSMLHVNCDMRMRWETDILQLRPSTHDTNSNDNDNNNGSTNTNFATSNSNTSSNNTQDSSDVDLHSSSKKRGLQKKGSRNLDPTTEQTSTKKSRDVRIVSLPQLDDQVQDDVGDTQEDANDNLNCNGVVLTPLLPPTTTISAPSANKSYSYVTATGHQQQQTPKSSQRFEPLSPIEEWTDDVELLRSLLQANGNVGFKCTIGNLLRTTNPARFTNRSSVRNFLAQSIEAGVVVESGEGHYKELSLPDTIATITTTTGANRISVSKSIPLEMLNAVPERVVEVSARRPYVLFVPKKMLSSRFTNPKGAFVKESRGRWLILMFLSFLDVQKAVEELPQLTDCTLVDWRNCQSLDDGEACGSCCRCLKQLLESEIIYKTTKTKSCGGAGPSAVEFEEHAYCVDCYEWNTQDGERGKAADRVVAMLTMMAEHDDIYVARKLLKKQLFSRYTDTGLCTTHKHAELWIDEAIRADQVVPLKKEGQKKILVCLTSNLQLANSDTATDDQDGRETSLSTSKEIKHVEDLLLRQVDLSHQWISRKVINASLQATFPRMDTPFMRAKVFQNGYALKRFCIARGHFGQTVGVTEQDAQESLERMNKTTIEELEWNLENGSSGGSSKGDGDGGGGAPKAPDDMKPNDDANDHSITPLVDNESTVAGGYKDTATTESIEHVVIVVAGNVTNDKDKVDIVGDPDDSSKSDVLSEWDGESMNSADIDALLFGRSKIDASKKIIEGEGLCQQDDFIIPDKVDGPLS